LPLPLCLKGKYFADEIKNELKEEINDMARKPCLAIIQVGSTTECNKSVHIKKSLCQEIGIVTLEYIFPEHVDEETLLETGDKFLSVCLSPCLCLSLPASHSSQ
jgi:5,10-methylene-tetrahydrofolate dehydrogenase/methenyl tetrahydrofolate cyclohydrolase